MRTVVRRALAPLVMIATMLNLLSLLIEPVRALASDNSILWGPYNSHLFFDVRPRVADSSFRFGIMWTRSDGAKYLRELRHGTDSSVTHFEWIEYDVRTGGRQRIHDPDHNIDIDIDFVKSRNGLSWIAQISGKPIDISSGNPAHTLYLYVGSHQDIVSNQFSAHQGLKGPITLNGRDEGVGDFQIQIVDSEDSKHPNYKNEDLPIDTARTFVLSSEVPVEQQGFVRDMMLGYFAKVTETFEQSSEMPPAALLYLLHNQQKSSNFYILQKLFSGHFQTTVSFSPRDSKISIDPQKIGAMQRQRTEKFNSKFDTIFKVGPKLDAIEIDFRHELLSNLLGGLSFFHGKSIVDRSFDPASEDVEDFYITNRIAMEQSKNAREEGPFDLLTFVPSRVFFPRGFLWDEGFHLLPVIDWDRPLAIEVMNSWFNLMDDDGYICREQILGKEARARVPEKFQVQFSMHANPPALILAVEKFLDTLDPNRNIGTADHYEDQAFLEDTAMSRKEAIDALTLLFPKLVKHYEWFRKTQYGEIEEFEREAFSSEAYRWRGRTEDHCLASGIDDYPRPRPPDNAELHVDLLSWITYYSRILKRLAEKLDKEDEAERFASREKAQLQNLMDLHWSEKERTFCDATINNDCKFHLPFDFQCLTRRLDQNELVCHKGYVSLLPMMLGLLEPHSKELKGSLDIISSPDHLWTPFGLRSLSKSDGLSGSKENYWRGPIWMNMNYLVLSSLFKNYISVPGPLQKECQRIYRDLRMNTINTVYSEWKSSHTIWEQYNEHTGRGQSVKGFTGWTSLILNILSESY